MDVNESTADRQPSPVAQSEGDWEFYRNLHWYLYFALTFPDLVIRLYHFAIEPVLRYFDLVK